MNQYFISIFIFIFSKNTGSRKNIWFDNQPILRHYGSGKHVKPIKLGAWQSSKPKIIWVKRTWSTQNVWVSQWTNTQSKMSLVSVLDSKYLGSTINQT